MCCTTPKAPKTCGGAGINQSSQTRTQRAANRTSAANVSVCVCVCVWLILSLHPHLIDIYPCVCRHAMKVEVVTHSYSPHSGDHTAQSKVEGVVFSAHPTTTVTSLRSTPSTEITALGKRLKMKQKTSKKEHGTPMGSTTTSPGETSTLTQSEPLTQISHVHSSCFYLFVFIYCHFYSINNV